MFADRKDAGRRLARALGDHRQPGLVVLGLPRGGVVVAAEVARELDADLDVVLGKKLRAPGNPELAVGAISESGAVFLNPDVMDYLEVAQSYLEKEKAVRLAEIREQAAWYRQVRPKISLGGRPVILVDDGLATGATMIAAVQSTALEHPASIVVAVPGGADDTVRRIGTLRGVREVVCLEMPAFFSGVSQLYERFEQVPDEEVIRILAEHARREARS